MNQSEVIVDPDVAAFISNRERGRHLDPFLAVERTVGEAALELGVSPQRMHYWVKQMEALGLLRALRSEVRGRSRTTIYRASADTYLVPLELLPTTDFETLELHFLPIWRRFLRSLASAGRRYAAGWVVRYGRSDGLPAFHIEPSTPPVGDVPVLNAWARLKLAPATAVQLKIELEALLGEYMKLQDDDGGKPWLIHVGVVEAEEEA